jgi:serine acetyltransferase
MIYFTHIIVPGDSMPKQTYLTILTLAGLAFSQDPWDASISWSISGETVFSTSKHFDIRKKPTHEDGSANNPQPIQADMNTAFGFLENAWKVYHDQMRFVVPDSASATKHKVRVYLYEKIDALYGGADQYGPGLWLGIGALKDNWGLSHEYSHGLQSISGGMQRSDFANWFYESHANWMAHQVIPTNAHCSEMLVNYPYLYYGSTRDRYCNWQFFEYLKDRHGGTDAVNDIWRYSLRANQSGVTTETPLTALMRNKNWTVSMLNDTMGFWAMHNVTWDYSNGAVYRSAYGSYDNRSQQKRNRVTMLERTDSTNNRYVSPDYWSPQALGYNLVRIYPNSAGSTSTVTVKFRGIAQTTAANTNFGNYTLQPTTIPSPNSDWRWGLVAITANDQPRYSALQKGTTANLDFQVLGTDKALYLVVMATPSQYTRIFWDQMYYTLYRYPYQIELGNAKAEGYQTNAWAPPAGTTCRPKTANWQGCVATTATVDASVFVAPNARILGSSKVSGNVRVEGMGTIQNATVSGNAIIRDQSRVLGGTVSENALIEDHASVYSGTVNGDAKVGALSLILGGTVSGQGKLYGVMNQLGNGVTINGTAQMLGDMEIYSSISSGVFYGMVDDGIKGNASYGATRTAPVTEVTSKWLPNPVWPDEPTELIPGIKPHGDQRMMRNPQRFRLNGSR